jgi:hypothetical protein
MTTGNIEITPSTKVNDLLDAYPEIEEILIGIAPPFKKLKNKFLRKSVAKAATLKHISSVGNVPLNELINKLREAVGQPKTNDSYEDENYFSDRPEWFSVDKISLSLNEESLLKDENKMTLVTILQEARNVKKGEIVELTTSFLPAPGIDKMKAKGYSVWAVKKEDDLVKSYFLKNTD